MTAGASSVLSRVTMAVGALALATALLADVVGLRAFDLGQPGFGRRQVALAVGGAVLILVASARLRGGQVQAFRSAPRVSIGGCVSLGAFVGLMTGALEVAQQMVRQYGFGTSIGRPLDLLWMTPTAHLVLFAALGAALALVRTVLGGLLRLPVVVFALVACAVATQTLLYGALAPWAKVVVSLAVGAQAARTAAAHPLGWLRTARVGSIALASALVLAAGAVRASYGFAERRALAQLPEPPAAAPNVLLVVLDTVRADHLASYGYARATTPNIDALAAHGALFERAIATAPWTLPSHASLFTGRYYHENSADWLVGLDDANPTLAEVLSARGYSTAGFVGNLNYCTSRHGLARGFAHFEDFPVSLPVMGICTRVLETALGDRGLNFVRLIRNDAEHVTNHFLDWLEGQGERPFFAFLNYFDAHALYITRHEYADRFGPVSPHLRQWYNQPMWPAQEMQGFVDAYDACLSFADAQLQRVFAALSKRGLLDNTLVIVTADHGELFGEHDLKDHSNSLYAQLLHVPLLILPPSRSNGGPHPGLRVSDAVTLRDVAATVLDLVGADAVLPGRSLARFWTEAPPPGVDSPILAEVSAGINRPANEPVSKGDMWSLFDGGLHYIRNGDGVEELFDFYSDPQETRDLAKDPKFAPRLGQLRDAARKAAGR